MNNVAKLLDEAEKLVEEDKLHPLWQIAKHAFQDWAGLQAGSH